MRMRIRRDTLVVVMMAEERRKKRRRRRLAITRMQETMVTMVATGMSLGQ